jgi:hypothetical protein
MVALEVPYYTNVPFLFGDGQAVQYSLKPRRRGRSRIPVRPSDNYLPEAMARTLADGDWGVRLHGPGPDRPHLMRSRTPPSTGPKHLSP